MGIDLPLSIFCEFKNTKYSCIDCGIVVCNVYAVSVKSNYSGFDKELKKVGICKKCSKKWISVEPPRKKVQKKYIFHVSKTKIKPKLIL